jgi:hypothetical protein
VVVYDATGSILFSTSASVPSTSINWNKFTTNLPVTLNPGLHSWCVAYESTATAYNAASNFGNALNAQTTGAKVHNYTCNTPTTGTGATFTIPTNGNCAASGTRTPVSMSATTPGAAVLVMVNP